MHTLSAGSKHTHCFGAQQRKLRTCTVVTSYHLSSCAPQAQAALSAAIGLTMPQHTQHSLIHVLLLWTTILSIIQAVFIIFFFSAGHHGPSQNNSAVAAESMPIQANNAPSPPSNDSSLLGKGKMLTFTADQVAKDITWVPKSADNSPVSKQKEVLTIMKDGYYFIILQVTMSSCKGPQHKVSLKWNNKVLLQGQILTDTCSTGLLAKVEEMSAGGTVVVSIDPPSPDVNTTESVTHLDFIYMHKP